MLLWTPLTCKFLMLWYSLEEEDLFEVVEMLINSYWSGQKQGCFVEMDLRFDPLYFCLKTHHID